MADGDADGAVDSERGGGHLEAERAADGVEDIAAGAEHARAEHARAEYSDRLETWALATFAVVTLGLVLVLVGHLQDGLSGPLSDLGTVPGFLLFGYLWVLSLVGVRWALDGGGLRGLRSAGPLQLVGRGAGAGAIVGAGFVLGLLLVLGLPNVLTGGFPVVGLVLYGGIGTVVGAVIGGLVGVAFAVLAAGFSRATDALVGPPSGG